MKRSFTLLTFALIAAACSSSPQTGKNGGAQTGSANGNGAGNDNGSANNGQPDDPTDPNDPTEQGGDNDAGAPGNDVGVGGGGSDGGVAVDGGSGGADTGTGGGMDGGGAMTCPAAPHGWRSMASASGVNLVALGADGFVSSATVGEAVWTGKEVLALGGDAACAHFPCRNIAVAYDPAKDAWRTLSAPPLMMVGQTRWVGDRWLVVGNVMGSQALMVVSYDPSTNAWTTLAAPPLSDRDARSVSVVWATTTHELLLWGGDHDMSTNAADGAAFNPVTGAWRGLAASPLSARADAAAAWDGTRMVIVGGGFWVPGKGDGDAFNENALADAAAYDPATNTWSAMPTPSFTPRMQASGVSLHAGESFVFGGSAHNTDNESGMPLWDGARIDGAASAWTAVSAPPITIPTTALDGRFGSTFVRGDGFFFVWGGAHADGSTPDFADGATFDLATGAWVKLPTGPSPRYDAIGVWTGCDVMVYGGDANGTTGVLQNGMMYRP